MCPEGPEVRRTADWLEEHVEKHVVRSVASAGRFEKKPIARLDELKHKRCLAVRCRGKVIVLDFEEGVSAISTLGMSGRWTFSPDKHVALTLWRELPPARGILPVYYVDQRRFGDFKVVDTREAIHKLDDLGWDPLIEPSGFGKARVRALKHTKKPISEVLLNQEVFAGVGNYVRAEALFRAKVNPDRLVVNIPDPVWDSLCEAVAAIMKESYDHGGATLKNFYDGDGNRGDHVDFLSVYGKVHDPNGNMVERKKDRNGRTVWWVPEVQR